MSDRYSRQTVLPQIGPEGQQRIAEAKIVLVGCGALGTHLAQTLARAGVGLIRIIDRDVVERTNLQRQVLFTEADAHLARPKAEAAADRLVEINSDIQIEPVATDLTHWNVGALFEGASLVLDGTDNMGTRLLINDACLHIGIPWVYAGVVGTGGHVLAVIPEESPCFRCYMPELPPPGTLPTCDVAGVLGSAVAAVTAIQASMAIQLMIGMSDEPWAPIGGRLVMTDPWERTFREVSVSRLPGCPACAGKYEFLEGAVDGADVVLCGREAVQISGKPGVNVDMEALAARLGDHGEVRGTSSMVRFVGEGLEMLIFSDGRGIVRGTSETAVARSFYDKFIGR